MHPTLSVLYVDDDECLLDICRAFLTRAGNILVDTAVSVDEALRLLSGKEYDAIISDYEMPVRNGIDFLKTLRAQGNTTPFIIFTGRGREEIMVQAFDCGADSYIQKGGEPKSQFAELVQKVMNAARRRQNEQALRRSNSLLRATLEATADGILVIGDDDGITTWNDKFVQLWELKGEIGTFRSGSEVFRALAGRAADPAAFQEQVDRARSAPGENTYDVVVCRNGRIFRRFSQAQKIDDRIIGRVWSFRDITEQNRTEHQLQAAFRQLTAAETELVRQYGELERSTALLRENEEKYRNVIDFSPMGMHFYEMRPDGALIFSGANPAADRTLGVENSRFIGMTIEEAFPGLAGTEIPDRYREIAREGTVWHTDQVSYELGEIRGAYAVQAFRIRPGAMVAVFSDITQRKQAEDELRLANIKLNLLLGITRHDILNRIAVLGGYNDLLRQRITDPPLLELLERQEQATDSIRKQIDFTKEYDELGMKSPRWHRIDSLAGRAYAQILQTITFTCDTANLEVYAEPMIEKVFYNLFDNSFRYGEGITTITISWSRAGNDLLLHFADNGIGIRNEEKERIFQRGYGRNTGLGLYLTREILSITGMTIRESGEYTLGAHFEIRVPEGKYRFLKPGGGSQGCSDLPPVLAGQTETCD